MNDPQPFDMFGVGQKPPESNPVIQPQLLERLKRGKDDGDNIVVELIQNLADSIIAVFSHEGGVIGWGLEVINDFIEGIPILGDIYALLRKLITGQGDAVIPEILADARATLEKIPIIGDLMEIISGVEDGNLNDVGTWVNNLLSNLGGLGRNTNRILLELQAKLAEGATFSDTFDRPNSGSISSATYPWVTGGQGSALEIMENAARLNGLVGLGAGIRYAICPVKAGDNDVSVSVGVNNKGISPLAMTTLFLRANADLTEFVYANIYRDRVYIGRGTRSGNTWTFNDWKPNTAVRISEGSLIEFQAEGTTYRLINNGETLLSHTDTSGYPIDLAHRTVGFAQETRFVAIIPAFSWGIVAFTMRSQIRLTAVETAVTKATTAATDVAALGSTVVDVARTVDQLVGERDGETSNGASYYWNFGSLGQGYTLTMFNHSDNPHQIGITPQGFADVLNAGAIQSSMWTQVDKVLTNDAQKVSVVIGNGTTLDASTAVIMRCNLGRTEFVMANIDKDFIQFYRCTSLSSTAAVSSTAMGPAMNHGGLGAGTTFSFTCVGQTFAAYRNGNLLGTFTNVGTPTAVGVAFRHCGLYFKQTAGFFTIEPPRIASFSISDYIVAQYKGTGFRLQRNNVAQVSVGTGQYPMVANIYDVIVGSPNVTVLDLGRGRVKIKKPGWYTFAVRISYATIAGTATQYVACLFKEGDGVGQAIVAKGPDIAGSNVYAAAGVFTEYCFENDIVQPGLYLGNARSIVGSLDGASTYFTGALTSN